MSEPVPSADDVRRQARERFRRHKDEERRKKRAAAAAASTSSAAASSSLSRGAGGTTVGGGGGGGGSADVGAILRKRNEQIEKERRRERGLELIRQRFGADILSSAEAPAPASAPAPKMSAAAPAAASTRAGGRSSSDTSPPPAENRSETSQAAASASAPASRGENGSRARSTSYSSQWITRAKPGRSKPSPDHDKRGGSFVGGGGGSSAAAARASSIPKKVLVDSKRMNRKRCEDDDDSSDPDSNDDDDDNGSPANHTGARRRALTSSLRPAKKHGSIPREVVAASTYSQLPEPSQLSCLPSPSPPKRSPRPRATAPAPSPPAKARPPPPKKVVFSPCPPSAAAAASSSSLGVKKKKKKKRNPFAASSSSESESDTDLAKLAGVFKRKKEAEEAERRRKEEEEENKRNERRELEERRERERKRLEEGEEKKDADLGSDTSAKKKKGKKGTARKGKGPAWERDDSSSSDSDDLGGFAAAAEQNRKEDEERRRPHNPIAAMRKEQETIMASFTPAASKKSSSRSDAGRLSSSSGKARRSGGGRRSKRRSDGDSSSDSDDDVDGQAQAQVQTSAAMKKKGTKDKDDSDSFMSDSSKEEIESDDSAVADGSRKKKSKKPASSDGTSRAPRGARQSSSSSSSGRKKGRKTAPDAVSALFEGCGVGSDDSDSEDNDDELLQRLKPHFRHAKLGVGELEPYVMPLPATKGGPPRRNGAGEPPCQLEPNEELGQHEVPAAINRYLKDYQREGISFVHSTIMKRRGCILGDDMGLGKTVQIISLLAALQKKTGTEKDLKLIQQRTKRIAQAMKAKEKASDSALLTGMSRTANDASQDIRRLEDEASKSGRILIVVPPSVIQNWKNEFENWGHFAVCVYQDKERDRENALERIRLGITEVMICGKSLFSQEASFERINSIKWRLIIVDEFHEYKNHNARGYQCLQTMRSESLCPIVGLTGTLFQNNYQEPFNLVDLVQPGLLGDWGSFKKDTEGPLLQARKKTATSNDIERGEKRLDQFNKAMKFVYLSRRKDDVLKDTLTNKDEKVIFCEMTDIQKSIYRRIMCLPDYTILRISNTPCDCGVNQVWFQNYQKMRNRKEQLGYHRRHKNELVKKKECSHCMHYRIPLNPDRNLPGEPMIDPEAVLWRSMHENDQECDREKPPFCPTCILLPALHKLYKVCSHASLLQAEQDPDHMVEGTKEWEKAKKILDFAKVALPDDVLPLLPGGSYIRENRIMDDHTQLSGKMTSLDICLEEYHRRRDRVLIFSYSTKTLDLIQHYVRSKGYSHRRLDGGTPTKKRQALIDDFQNNNDIFLFLISTKAGGLGLNLTAANKVIVFDVNWNPSYDEQAQDRSFRIGQNRDVEVIRLVAQGTVEEMMYCRQIYKVHLKKQALSGNDESAGPEAARMFRGVAGDTDQKGELFGIENLFKFKDGSFMQEIWKASDRSSGASGSRSRKHDVSAVANALSSLTEDQVENLGGEELPTLTDEQAEGRPRGEVNNGSPNNNNNNEQRNGNSAPDLEESNDLEERGVLHHEDFLRGDRGGAALEPGDEGFDEEAGGASQMVLALAHLEQDEDDEDEDDDDEKKPPAAGALEEIEEETKVDEKRPAAGSSEDSGKEEASGEEEEAQKEEEQASGAGNAAASEKPSGINDTADSDDRGNRGAPGVAAGAASRDEENDQAMTTPKRIKREATANLMIITDLNRRGPKTPKFSSRLLHRPSYQKKRKRK